MYWLLYDIPNNRTRLKLVRLCKDSGLTRVQKSCFFGEIRKDSLGRLMKEIETLVSPDDSVYLIPINQNVVSQTKVWGKAAGYEARKPTVCFF